MDSVKKEIREALLGDLVPTTDGRLAVSFTRLAKYRNGLGDGYDKVLIFGVTCIRRWYLSTKNAKQLHELAVKGMQDMGRMMWLSSDPDREAVYCSYLMNAPAVLTYVRGKDGVIEVACYAARCPSGWIACFRTLNKFQKKVPEVLQRMSEEDERNKRNKIKEKDAEDKLSAKKVKKEKKRLRKEKRKERMRKMFGFLPKMPELSFQDKTGSTNGRIDAENQQRNEIEQEAVESVKMAESEAMEEQKVNIAVENVTRHSGSEDSAMEAAKAEQIRLEKEAEQAKLAAQAAKARLEAAEAKLAAQEAQARLAEVEAKLQAQETQISSPAQTAETEGEMPDNVQNSDKSSNSKGNGGSKKRKRKK